MAKWSHLFPYRTQKLSTLAATIAMHAIVKIAHRQVTKLPQRELFSWNNSIRVRKESKEENKLDKKLIKKAQVEDKKGGRKIN